MTALGVIAPDRYLGVTESIDLIVAAVDRLVATGAAYRLPAADAPGSDVYLDVQGRPGLGDVSGATRAQMLALSAERGGDPERLGKRDALDPLLWRAARDGRAVVGRWSARRRAARVAHRVHVDRAGVPRYAVHRAGRGR